MTDISSELAKFRDHARKQASRLEKTIAAVERDRATRGARRCGKSTQLARLNVLLREHALWVQLAGEIDTYEQKPDIDTAELQLWGTKP